MDDLGSAICQRDSGLKHDINLKMSTKTRNNRPNIFSLSEIHWTIFGKCCYRFGQEYWLEIWNWIFPKCWTFLSRNIDPWKLNSSHQLTFPVREREDRGREWWDLIPSLPSLPSRQSHHTTRQTPQISCSWKYSVRRKIFTGRIRKQGQANVGLISI